MIGRVIVRTVAALVILLTPLAAESCEGSGKPGASNPDAGRGSGGGDRAKVMNSFLSKAAVTVYYGKASESIKPAGMSDLGRNATRVCFPKGHGGDVTIGRGKARKIKSGACRDLGDVGNAVVNVVVK